MKNVKSNIKLTKPFLKWAGGKLRIVDKLKAFFPQDGQRFIEPFVGAGSVCLNVNYPKCIINDINTDLTSIYKLLKTNKKDFIQQCKQMFVQQNNTKDMYYKLREEFNNLSNTNSSTKIRNAVLFVYLNRHCFNGLCRYNSKGGFNVPFGKYTKPYFPEKELMCASTKIRKFQIKSVDFRKIFESVQNGDVVYCDPPYLPKSETASFSDYTMTGFVLQDHIDLAQCAFDAANRGATVIICNHWNKEAKKIYKDTFHCKTKLLNVSRTISCNAKNRKPVKEVIAIFE